MPFPYLYILFISFALFSLSKHHSLNYLISNHFSHENIKKILITLNDQLLKLSSKQFKAFYLKETSCSKAIKSSIVNLQIENLILYSSNFNNILGSESLCLSNNFTYHFITYDTDSAAYNPSSSIDLFLGITRFHMALCLWKDCDETVEAFLDPEVNNDFFKELLKEYQIVWMELLSYDSKENALSIGFVIFWCCIGIVVGVRMVFAVIGMGMRLNEQARWDKENSRLGSYEEENKDKKDKGKEKDDDVSITFDGISNGDDSDCRGNSEVVASINNQQDALMKEDISETTLFANANSKEDESEIRHLERYLHDDIQNMNNNINHKDTNNNIEQNSINKSSFLSKWNIRNIITNILDFGTQISFSRLSTHKTNLYNSTSLESISGIRVILLFLYIFNLTFRLFYKVSPIHKGYSEIYFTKAFYIIKLSSYSIYCLIYLDGFIFIFKLMHYIKGHDTFKRFLMFYLKNIPRLLIFLIIFFFFYLFINNYAIVFGKTSLFKSYYKSHFQKVCFISPYSLLNPYFFFQLHVNSYDCEYCYRFCYLIIQEFYCFTIITAMLYLLKRIRLPMIDIGLFIVSLISIGLSYVFYIKLFATDNIDEKMTGYDVISPFKFVIGESITLMQTVLVFNLFFIGVMTGLMYYYYVESLKEVDLFLKKSMSVRVSFVNLTGGLLDEDYNDTNVNGNVNGTMDADATAAIQYVPFDFLLVVIKGIHRTSKIVKMIIMLVSLSLIVVLSMNYTFMKMMFIKKTYDLIIPMNPLVRIVYVYETPVAVMLFALFLLVFMFSDSKIDVKLFFSHKIFYTVERVSFEIYCISEWMILLFYTLFNLEGTKWNLMTLVNISCFMFVLILIQSLLLCFFFHLPLKYITKRLLGNDHPNADVYA